MKTPVLELNGLKKEIKVGFRGRRVQILKGVNLSVPKGAIFGFIGPNGAGKSTTIKLSIGAAMPSSGTVTLFGVSPRAPSNRHRLGYLPEFPRLPEQLSPRELLTLHAHLADVPADRVAERCDALLERVALKNRGDHRVSTFSKGLQQRVGLALALVGEPELLILDEPMSGLDPVGRRLVREIIVEQKKLGHTIFFSSHVLPDVEALCDEVALLVGGQVAETDVMAKISGSEASAFEVVFRARDVPPPVAQTLGTLSARGQSYVLKLSAKDDFLAVAMQLREAGCTIDQIERRKPSLEEHLMTLIGGGLSASSPQTAGSSGTSGEANA